MENSYFSENLIMMILFQSGTLDIEGLSNTASGISTILSQASNTNPSTEILEDMPVSSHNINLDDIVEAVDESQQIDDTTVMQFIEQIRCNPEEEEPITPKTISEPKSFSDKIESKPLINTLSKSKV